MDPVETCARAEAILRPLSVTAARAAWDANVAATDENEQALVAAETALSDARSDTVLFADVEAALATAPEGITHRQLEVLRAGLLTAQAPAELRHRIVELEAKVEATFSRHRGVVGGREVPDNEIKVILRGSNDIAERREAWEASKTVGAAVADRVRALARLRNEIARGQGYRDWFAFSVAAQEMDEDRLLATLDACDVATREPYARWKAELDASLATRFGCAASDLRPWHYADPFFQDLPADGVVDLDPFVAERDVVALAGETCDALGLAAGAILSRSDLYPRDGKCQHAFCIDIDREGDVRVLANVRNDASWAETMLHELGHGVYFAAIDRSLPWTLRDCHTTVTEGIAMVFESHVRTEAWLHKTAGAADAPAQRGLTDGTIAERLLFTRWVLVMTGFERALYADPDGDLDAIWWDLVERFQLVTRPEGRSAPDWAAKIHIACAPVYYHCYLYGRLISAQLRVMLAREDGGAEGSTGAGRLLVERVFAAGESVRWDRLMEQATGEPLSVRHFAAELAA